MPTIQPNNNTSLYNAAGGNTIPINGNITANNVNVSNNVTVGGQISATGNITTAGFFIGNGSLLTNINAGNIVGGYGNANVATFMANFGSNTVSTTGNISGGFILGNGSQLTGLPATYSNANVTTLMAAFGSNAISTTGNVTAGYFIGDGSLLTGLPASYGNANVAAFLPTYTGNLSGGNLAVGNNASVGGNLSVTGTIFGTFAGNISGNLVVPGSNTDVLFNNAGNAGASTNFRFDSATNTMLVNGTANVGVLNATGNVTSANIVASANAVVGGINTDNYRYANGVPVSFGGTYGNANVADFLDSFGSNAIVTTGNITGGNIIGNGQSLTNLPGANVVGAVANATFATSAATATSANSVAGANVTGTVASATQANTANVANSVAGANVTGTVASATQAATANVANSVAGGNVTGQVANALVAGTVYTNAQPNITSVGTLSALSVTGNITTGGILTNGYYFANGTPVTFGGGGTYGDANVTTLLAAFGSNTISTSGNITGGNIIGNIQAPGANTEVLFNNNGVASANNKFTYSQATNTLQVDGGQIVAGNFNAGSGVIQALNGNLVQVNSTTISASGNVTGANIIGNGQFLTNLPGANVTGTVANATFATSAATSTTAASANSVAGANVTGTVASATQANTANVANSVSGGNVSGQVANALVAGTVYTAAQPAITSVGTLTSLSVTGNVVPGGINTDNYRYANGTPVSFAGTYGNANVSSYLASGTNTANIVTTGNIQGNVLKTSGSSGNITGVDYIYANTVVANATVQSTGRITAGAVTYANTDGTAGQVLTTYGNGITYFSTVGGSTYGDANVNTLLAAWGSNTLSTTGTLTAGNITGGNLNTAGNVSGSYILGDGSQLTNLPVQPGTYGNANVNAHLAAFGSNVISTTGNITGSNVNVSTVQATGSGGLALKNASGTTQASMGGGGGDNFAINVSTNINGANAQIDISPTGTGHVYIRPTGGNSVQIQPTTAGSINNMVIGNVTPLAANFTTVSATGNISGNYFVGNGSALTGITSTATAGGSNTQIQFNDGSVFAGNANMTFDKTTGNVVLGNIVTNTNNIQTVGAIDYANATAAATTVPWRIVMGNAYNGVANSAVVNTTPGTLISPMNSPRLLVADLVTVPNNGMRINEAVFMNWVIPTANISNSSSRFTVSRSEITVGGSVNNYAITGTSPFTIGCHASQIVVGAGTNANLSAVGNVAVSGGAMGMFIGVNTQPGSNVVYATGAVAQLTANDSAGVFGNITNMVGFSPQFSGTPANANITATTNAVGFYQPQNGSSGIYGTQIQTANIARMATNYHAFRNDDDLARSRLGTLERMHYLTANVTSSGGNVTIDKNNGQVQQIYLTEAITGATFTNFAIRQLKPNATFQNSADEVTLIFQQGATPYNITLPSGNAQIRYANGVSTVTGVANTTVMIDVVGVYNYNTSAPNYLITVNPAFS
jgi:hypothetical protein